ncbi:MAG: hypothetical protein Q7S22_00005, partial [Candidatus Micrarchaeota archaeon]|nr:hypothetical protein [Candidatus Micrarchaeota archaeon]
MSLLERKISVVNPIAIPRNIFPNPLSDRNPPLSQTLAVVFAIGYAGEGDRERIRNNIELLGQSSVLFALKDVFPILYRAVELRYIERTMPFDSIAVKLGEEFGGKYDSNNAETITKAGLEWLKNYVLIDESGGFQACVEKVLSEMPNFDAPDTQEVMHRLRRFAAQRGGEPAAITFLLHQQSFDDFVTKINPLLKIKISEVRETVTTSDIFISDINASGIKTKLVEAMGILKKLGVMDELREKNKLWYRI